MFLQTIKKKIDVIEEEIPSRCSHLQHSMRMAAQQPREQSAGITHCVCTGSCTKRCGLSCGAASLCHLFWAGFKHPQLHEFIPSGDHCPTGHGGTLLFIWTPGLACPWRPFQCPLGEERDLCSCWAWFSTPGILYWKCQPGGAALLGCVTLGAVMSSVRHSGW